MHSTSNISGLFRKLSSYLLLIIIIGIIGYQHTQTYAVLRTDEMNIEMWLNPAHILVPEKISAIWTGEGAQDVLLNDEQVNINDIRQINGDYCQAVIFTVVVQDGTSYQFNLQPVIWSKPSMLFLLMLAFLLVSLIGVDLHIPVLHPVGERIHNLLNFSNDSYWQQNGMLWIRVLLATTAFFILHVSLLPDCLQDEVLPVSSPFIGTGIVATIALLISMVRPQLLITMISLWKRWIPYTLTIFLILIYWISITSTIFTVPKFHRIVILMIVLCIGIVFLLVTRNTRHIEFNFALHRSPSGHGVIWIVLLVGWGILYLTNWGDILNNSFLQTCIGLTLFILPGLLLSTIVLPKQPRWAGLVSSGFLLSVFITLLLWLVSIIFGLSSNLFQFMFAGVGAVSLLYLVTRDQKIHLRFFRVPAMSIMETIAFGFGLFSFIMIITMMINMYPVDGDHRLYNAIITEFAESPALSLREPFLGTGLMMRNRLWLMVWLVSQSLIVSFSDLNILESFQHINLVLVFVLGCALYELLRRFNVPRLFALLVFVFTGLAIFTQLNGISETGFVFLFRLSQDKVIAAWIFTPIVVAILYDFLKHQTIRYAGLFVIAAITSVNVHATIFFYIAIIGGVFSFLYVVFQSKQWKHILFVGMVFVGCALVPFILRETGSREYTLGTADVEEIPSVDAVRLALDDDLTLYGINPELRDGSAVMLVYIASVLALFTIQRYPLGYYIMGGVILLMLVSNPLTAPIIAKFVTLFQLWRVTWLIPFGVAGVFVVMIFYLCSKTYSARIANALLLLVISIILITTIDVFESQIDARLKDIPDRSYFNNQPTFDALIEIADFIQTDGHDEQYTVFAETSFALYVPSSAYNIHAILWHNQSRAGIEVEHFIQRDIDHSRFYAEDLTVEELHSLLDKYNIRYLLVLPNSKISLRTVLVASPQISDPIHFGVIDVWIYDAES